jgi:hypothetical protein
MSSTWSTRTDGFGWYYGTYHTDHRQMNVRRIIVLNSPMNGIKCEAFVGGDYIGEYDSLAEAQVACETYIEKTKDQDGTDQDV